MSRFLLLNWYTVTFSATNGTRRSVRHRGASVAVATAALLIGLGGAVIPAAPASAATPTITSPVNNTLVTSTVTITGTKDAASTIRIPSPASDTAFCPGLGAGEITWSCDVTLPASTTPWDVAVFEDIPGSPSGEAHVSIRVLGTPTISGPAVSSGAVSGTATPGAGILITGTGIAFACPPAQGNGSWSCQPPAASGSYSLTATETWPGTGEPGGSSAPFAVTFDKDAPALPVFSQPSSDARITTQPTTFAGSGEEGARVDVFVDSALVCSATVGGGQWSCSATLGAGQHTVQGIQWDAVGNRSDVTAGYTVTVAEPASSAPAPPSQGTPTAPVPAPTPSPTSQAPSPSASPTPSAAPTPMPTFPFFPPPIGGQSGLPPLETWGTPTHYGAAIPNVQSSWESGAWLVGVLSAVGFILLIALPLRMILAVVRGRRAPYVEVDENAVNEPPLLPPWATAALALGAAVALAALAGGIQGEVRYLRLVIAIGIALLVLNGVGVAIAAKLSSRALGGSAGIRLVPMFLVLAALTALISRGGGIQPPVIVGVVIAARFATESTVRQRGVVALAQLATITALGIGAWVGQSALGPVAGFWESSASETLAALCIAALGSALMLLLPVSRMPGRLLFEWSPVVWVGITLVVGTLAGIVIVGSATFPLPWVVGLACVFAAISVAVWAWSRYVDPGLVAADPLKS